MRTFTSEEKQLLEPVLERLFEDFYNYLLHDPYLKRYFTSDEQMRQLSEKQRVSLMESMEEKEEVFEIRYEKLGEFHHAMQIPLVELNKSVEFMYERFLELCEDIQEVVVFHKLHYFFRSMRQNLARGYFLQECQEIMELYQKELYHMPYYRVHVRWVMQLVEYFSTDKISKLPGLEYENRIFSQLLNSSSTRLLFRNSEELAHLESLNDEITLLAKSILFHVRQKKNIEAFTQLQRFIYLSSKIMHLMDRKSMLHFKNREDGFFAYIKEVISSAEDEDNHLLLINVKKLGLINKYKGLEAGDAVLDRLEELIKGFLVAYDENVLYIKATSGEFYIFFVDSTSEEVELVADSLLRLIESEQITYQEDDILVKLQMAAISINSQTPAAYLEKLLHYALERSKESKQPILFLGRAEEQRAIDLIEKANTDIRFVHNAILKDNLDVFFQPIIHLESGEVYDLEVLARIRNGDSYITAGAFINLIHELDIIVDLDTQIMAKIIELSEQIKKVSSRVFINVSPSSLKNLHYLDTMRHGVEMMSKAGIMIYFELTEQAFLDNIEIITQLHAEMGVKFAVDDFGTGYSSLKTVAELSEKKVIDFIKIDGSIVKDIHSSHETYQILDATSYMTKKLKLKNIAEFIETEEVLEAVKKLGIEYGQGYFFSKPLRIDQLIERYCSSEG